MTTPSRKQDLVGQLTWLLEGEGVSEPLLRNDRPQLVPTLTLGQPASSLPGRLSALFSMCGHAHRLTATRAVAAALGQLPTDQGSSATLSASQARGLQLETLREHLRRIWLDWPRQLAGFEGGPPHGLLELAYCPIMRPDRSDLHRDEPPWGPLRTWLEESVFQEDMGQWLQDWEAEGEVALLRWAQARTALPARLMLAAHAAAHAVHLPIPALPPSAMAALAQQLARPPHHQEAPTEAWLRSPTWQGQPCETGPWSRAHAPAQAAALPEASLWWRMGARLADIARLALPDDQTRHTGAHWLSAGVVSTAPGTALAWTEMARGILIHEVALALDQAPEPVALRCVVLSPTDWNFHPDGALARTLHAAPFLDLSNRLRVIPVLAAAYDPCVPLVVQGAHGQVLMRCPPDPALASSDEGDADA